MNAIVALGYVVHRGLRGMIQAPLVQVLAVVTIGVCMLLLGTITLAWANASSIADRWGVDVPITAYLVDDVDPVATSELVLRVGELPNVERVDVIGPEQAMARLRDGLGDDPALVAGLDPELLPVSLELHLDPSRQAPGEAVAETLRGEPLVEDVVVAGAWAERAQHMLDTLRGLALAAAGLVGAACLAIVWSTIRLAVYARRAEIEILRLVGGTGTFVHGPFVIEGLVQGLLGTSVAVALLWLGFDAAQPFLTEAFALAFAAGSLRFLTPQEAALLVAFGGVLGVLGSRAAVARYVET
ncbi:MAG TPA: permease-like cell division protein FtsX [Nannocystaceae bacterium]|nr:permease-like cell division protein FtsX [Nannocystaceae bacterium]